MFLSNILHILTLIITNITISFQSKYFFLDVGANESLQWYCNHLLVISERGSLEQDVVANLISYDFKCISHQIDVKKEKAVKA